MNRDIHKEEHSAEKYEEYKNNLVQSQSVSSLPPALKKHYIPEQTDSLGRHKLQHSDVKKNQCNICPKSFTESGNLSRHKLIHDGVKKYQCNILCKIIYSGSAFVMS